MLEEVREELDEEGRVREERLSKAREVRRLTKEGCSEVHGGDYGSAEGILDEALGLTDERLEEKLDRMGEGI